MCVFSFYTQLQLIDTYIPIYIVLTTLFCRWLWKRFQSSRASSTASRSNREDSYMDTPSSSQPASSSCSAGVDQATHHKFNFLYFDLYRIKCVTPR